MALVTDTLPHHFQRQAGKPALRETLKEWGERQALGLAYALKPPRLNDAPALALATLADLLGGGPSVPEISAIRARPAGYGGPVRDASPEAVIAAMRRGFFQHSHIGPLKWWSWPQRAIMPLNEVHIAKRFRRTLKTTRMSVSFDTAFAEVLEGCAARRAGRPHLTWLRPVAKQLYADLFAAGHAHSVEVRDEAGALVGGLFGVAVGPSFSAMSMFHTANDASKIAIVSLYHHLAHWRFSVCDHQGLSPWVETLGGRLVPRADYEALLAAPRASSAPIDAAWQAVFTPRQTADWDPAGRVPTP